MNRRGQVLLPGLAVYLMLLTAFFLTVQYARRELNRLRLENAAIAASLSAARALAQELNNAAAFNTVLNGFLIRYKGDAAMPLSRKKGFEQWLDAEKAIGSLKKLHAYSNGALGYVSAVGRQVARLNGADQSIPLDRLDLRLAQKDLRIWFVMPQPPWAVPQIYRELYAARKWGQDKRRAQPPHEVAWLAIGRGLRAAGAAALYLDVNPNEFLHNGGFPRDDGESVLGNLGVQAFYPQFAARRVGLPMKAVLACR